MQIFGHSGSGNCLKVKWTCDLLALPYRWTEVDTFAGGSRTPEFLALNPAGQVPVVRFDDGRVLAQSNAIIRYLARDSRLVPTEAFEAAKMDEWLFWEQYSHEPYIAVCRSQLVYLHKSRDQLDPEKVRRGHAALQRMESQLRATRFLVGERVTLADMALVAYTRVAHEGDFDLSLYPSLRRWIAEAERALGIVG